MPFTRSQPGLRGGGEPPEGRAPGIPTPERARPRWAADVGAAAHVFVPTLADELGVDGDDGHHLARVRRLRTGEAVTAADGSGTWRPYEIVDARGGVLALRASGRPVVEPELWPRLVVALALTKGGRYERVAQRVTELGADEIVPVRTARSVVRWAGPRAAAALDRLRRVTREAAEQSRRATVPRVEPPVALASLAARDGLVVADRCGRPAAELREPRGGEWVLVVGPEGGLEREERLALGAGAALAVGPHVLRADTAALAASAALAGRRRPRPA